jgi:DNA mismatch endonuclease, patch repair protein
VTNFLALTPRNRDRFWNQHMADVHTRAQRSYNMSRIRFRGNKTTEKLMVELLRKWRITGWRRNSTLRGRPDFIFPSHKVAIFVDGCFWHHCPRCRFEPSSNRRYWIAKFGRNEKRDKEVNKTLKQLGWTILRVWEHQLKRPNLVEKRIRDLICEK